MTNISAWKLAAGGLCALLIQSCGGGAPTAPAETEAPSAGAPGAVAATGRASSPTYELEFSISSGAAGAELSSPNHVLVVDAVGGAR